MLACHESLTVGCLDFVLNDLPRSVAFGDFTNLALEHDARASDEPEYRLRIWIVQRMQTTVPVNPERPDTVDLHDGPCRRIAKHRTALGSERIAACFELLQRLGLVFLAEPEVPGALDDSDIFIDGMRVRRDDRSGQLAYAHDKRFTGDLRIPIENFDVARHRFQRNDAGLAETFPGIRSRDARGCRHWSAGNARSGAAHHADDR